ncbi:gluconate kinase, SKI family [Modicisalibacter ilicicola DSM 19980]|uniref:Gluconokinase n=1 Tax=Modicisalibacter ilicicola DSM 19980 TaxID=1121942 RepID=A0A1M4SWF0_9GAMM|nr:gluconokinase [Halomonas ilicicola]SHE36536.1 gluconate kinase, SKI family [Halomonas ilicicola DSM 19980]
MKDSSHCILVMGVSGSGKSHIGRDIAAAIDAEFIDADDYHSAVSVAKMARGEPLDDADRKEWLETLGGLYRSRKAQGRDVVIGCSALKRRYRDVLRRGAPDLIVLYLRGSREVLLERLNNRGAHFFAGERMLDSQLHDLEPPDEKEAIHMDIRTPPEVIVERFVSRLEKS